MDPLPDHQLHARVGDHVSVESHRRGVGRRIGEILEVVGEPGSEYYRVRWADGHVTLYHPGSDTVVPEAVEREHRRERELAAAEPRASAAPASPAPARPAATASAPSTEPAPREPTPARPGDRLVIRHHHLGEPDRDAEILEVLGPDGGPPFRVRWSDTGREAIIRPGTDAYVDRLTSAR